MDKKRVIIIDDDPDYSDYLKILLNSTDWADAEVYNNSLKGLEACMTSPPECIVLDLDMPFLRGEEICRILRTRQEYHHIPIMIISQLPDARRKEMELLELGADEYRSKPVDPHDFIKTILVKTSLQDALRDDTSEPTDPNAAEKSTPEIIRDGAASPSPAETRLPKTFRGYQIMGMIGGGGMGTVYRASQLNLDRIVALKVLSPQMAEDSVHRSRFEREAKILARLSHPNIVQVYDVGVSDYAPFFVMEYVEGISLGDRIRKGPATLAEGIDLIRQISEALIYLHSKGIVHRDVKPSNILISSEGLVKLTDFGISRMRRMEDQSDLTIVSSILGTPGYIAPEVMKGGKATEFSDQYGFGVTIWCLFTGLAAKEAARTSLKKLRPDLPPEFMEALATCMAPEPEKRHKTMRDARDALLKGCGIQSAAWSSLNPIPFHEDGKTRMESSQDESNTR
ncbi:MAG TPA: protein kinase [Candidatus Sumerlaeota bacterium]|nr:protein kinase [Candidatus Sumerlaeota bacterium]